MGDLECTGAQCLDGTCKLLCINYCGGSPQDVQYFECSVLNQTLECNCNGADFLVLAVEIAAIVAGICLVITVFKCIFTCWMERRTAGKKSSVRETLLPK